MFNALNFSRVFKGSANDQPGLQTNDTEEEHWEDASSQMDLDREEEEPAVQVMDVDDAPATKPPPRPPRLQFSRETNSVDVSPSTSNAVIPRTTPTKSSPDASHTNPGKKRKTAPGPSNPQRPQPDPNAEPHVDFQRQLNQASILLQQRDKERVDLLKALEREREERTTDAANRDAQIRQLLNQVAELRNQVNSATPRPDKGKQRAVPQEPRAGSSRLPSGSGSSDGRQPRQDEDDIYDDVGEGDMDVDPEIPIALQELFRKKRELAAAEIEPLLRQATIRNKRKYAPGSKARYIHEDFDPASNPRVPDLPIPGQSDDPNAPIYVPGPTPGLEDINTAPSGPPTQTEKLWRTVADLAQRFEENAAFPQTLPRARKTVNTETSQWNRRRGARHLNRTTFLTELRLMQQGYLGIKKDIDVVQQYADQLEAHTTVTTREEIDFIDDVAGCRQPSLAVPMPVCWSHIRGPWNQVLAEQFCDVFTNKFPRYAHLKEKIRAEFYTRLDRQKQYLTSTTRLTQKPVEFSLYAEALAIRLRKRARANERRVTLHRVRLDTIKLEEQGSSLRRKANWQLLQYVLNMIGPQGESSDESPDEGVEDLPYPVRARAWRSEEITRLVKMVDAHRSFGTAYGNFKPGQRPHKRARIGPNSDRRAICGLPRNFYRSTFLQSLTATQRAQLHVLDEVELPVLNQDWDDQ